MRFPYILFSAFLFQEKLWNYLKEDKINLVVSDHSPCTPDLKCSNHLQAWGGISSVQFGKKFVVIHTHLYIYIYIS